MDENTPTSNETLLRELALRLSSYPGDPRVNDPQLLVGQIPQELSATIPLPEGSRVLGTLIRSQDNIDIVLDSSLSPGEVLNFYKARMQAAGWNELDFPPGPGPGGFVPTGFPGFENRVTFCKGSHGQALTVNAFEGKGAFTDVRLDLNAGAHSPCAQRGRMHTRMAHRGMGLHDLIPRLVPPVGARQQPSGGGGGSDSYYSSATLDTDIDLATLSSHYASQLEKSGWIRNGEGLDGPLAWHTWTFQDEDKEPWRGLFYILKVPGTEREHDLNVRVDWANKGEGGMRRGGGWFGYSSTLLS